MELKKKLNDNTKWLVVCVQYGEDTNRTGFNSEEDAISHADYMNEYCRREGSDEEFQYVVRPKHKKEGIGKIRIKYTYGHMSHNTAEYTDIKEVATIEEWEEWERENHSPSKIIYEWEVIQ